MRDLSLLLPERGGCVEKRVMKREEEGKKKNKNREKRERRMMRGANR